MTEHPAVDLWRRKFKLNLSQSWKRDVICTVKDLDLWKSILDNWFWIDAKGKKRTKHPGIKGLLTEYERLEADKRDAEAASLSARNRAGLSERSHSYLSRLPSEAERAYFGVGEVAPRRVSVVPKVRCQNYD